VIARNGAEEAKAAKVFLRGIRERIKRLNKSAGAGMAGCR
jgi:hypothetical protein